MQQQTFTDVEYSRRKKKTRREEFLNMMDKIIPWNEWINLIKPYYPSGKRGRPTRGIETMLRMYLMQNWFNLSDAAIEDTIYDSYAMRSFMHIDFYKEQVPGATILLKFRHLLEEHHIGEQIFADVNARLEKAGLVMRGGTIVDATIISAPPIPINHLPVVPNACLVPAIGSPPSIVIKTSSVSITVNTTSLNFANNTAPVTIDTVLKPKVT